MAKVAWVTDVHLNFVPEEDRKRFFASIRAHRPDALLLTGDISEGPDVCHELQAIERSLDCPIYFVLGNHDFYRRSIRGVVRQVTELAAGSDRLIYISAAEAFSLTDTTGIVGHDGWGDAGLGDYDASDVVLSDFFAIDELAAVQGDRKRLRARLEELGQQAATHLERVLPGAMQTYRRVVVLTHVPPFREAAWYGGKPSADDWLPFFSCRATGQVLRKLARRHPDCELLVLCGHTHGGGKSQILDNLCVLTGSAQYGRPRVNLMLAFD